MATQALEMVETAVDPLDVSRPELYRDDMWQAPFRQLRAESPVHYVEQSGFGPYWSVSSYKPIVQVESLPELYSSQAGGITLADFIENSPTDVRMPMFIAMDRPKHTGQRRTVASAFTPSEMVRLSDNIRMRTAEVLDSLEWNKEFDWVDTVSIELTTQMLGDPVRFPVGGPAQADLLVRLGRRYRAGEDRGASPRTPEAHVSSAAAISRICGTRSSARSPRPISSR